MAGMSGGSMLRTRRKDVNVKPNRRLDRKSSRGMLYENEELRLRTININAEVERGQSDIKKLKRENEQLRREVGALRGEYDRLERLLHQRQHQESPEPENQDDDKVSIISCCSDCSMDCCKISSSCHPEIVICDSSDDTKCWRYPACHSLEISGSDETSKDDRTKRKGEICQSDVQIKKNQTEENSQNEENTKKYTDDAVRNKGGAIRKTHKENNVTSESNLKKERDDKSTNEKNKRTSASAGETGEGGVTVVDRNGDSENVVVCECSCENRDDSDKRGFLEECPMLPGCRRLDLSMARCCGTFLSTVPEENGSQSWNVEDQPTCTCQTNGNTQEENKLETMAKKAGNFPDNKDYYKAIVTVPLSMHIPFENNNSITVHSEMHNTEMDENAISVFPKTTIDILMNNNSCETFAGFTTQQPLGFIVPPPLNQDNTMSDGPFQIVPNVDLFNSTFINTTSNDTNFGCYTPNYNEILSANNSAPMVGFFQSTPIVPQANARNNIPPTSNDMDAILNQSYNLTNTGNAPLFGTSLSQSAHFVTTSCQNVSSSNNDQSNTTVTSNGLVFSTNCPIMSSIATTSLNCHTVNDSPFVAPSGFSTPPFKQHGDFRNNSANDSVSDLNSNVSERGAFKDSYFVCKTRKVIQQMTTVHNSEAKTVTNPCGCTCRCNQQNIKPSKETTSETFSSVSDRNSQNTKFRTEKSIELNYDYPKTYFQPNCNKDGAEGNDGSKDDVRNISSSQTFQTTTEVNSTLYLFERKKVTSRSKNAKFKRSNSAPVDIPSDEPIYATVNKLSKKLKRLNIKNLENEIKYVPPDEKTATATKDKILEEKNEPNEEIKIENNDTKTDIEEKLEIISNNNGTKNKTVPKSDSFSESSDKTVGIQKISGTIRKKKKFSIRFKRKSSKNSCNSKISIDCDKADDEKQENLANGVSKDKLVLDLINSVESDKLIDASSSPDSPEVKTNNMQPNYCQKHGKPKHHHHYKTGCPSPRCYREEYPQHRCGMQNKKSSVTQGDSGSKKHLHPSRNYYKQDSYQEMTTSHSERERTNSLSSSGHSGFSLGSKGRSGSQSRREGSIPWCGCWGNSCL